MSIAGLGLVSAIDFYLKTVSEEKNANEDKSIGKKSREGKDGGRSAHGGGVMWQMLLLDSGDVGDDAIEADRTQECKEVAGKHAAKSNDHGLPEALSKRCPKRALLVFVGHG